MKGKRIMNRITVYAMPDDDDYGPRDGKPELLGWFDADKATYFKETKGVFDGANLAGVHLRDQNRGQGLYRTAQGRWVLEHWSNWQGETTRYEFITDAEAREWLIVNEARDGMLEQYFGPVEEERGPGRPEIGGAVHVRLGDDLLAQLDAHRGGNSRADAIRLAVVEYLTAARPYAISFRDISTGLRETDPERYATLGEAVEALREWERDDRERQQYRGLPSIQLRVEHDGRPVDVEAFAD
jgi:hypothetical protein